ncbi:MULTISPECIES: M14 family zinc carboxypeptidase [unclassified Bacillus (in: firmicutes)]|uniref:M14 family zinc carboxypeptidase n=1 Tax=unclassified Bacillus (in: firmicutes) TaxID=185979 RepID=UPI001BEBD564|nr:MULTISPECIES: M14 family zinc carboxypeptidase [unclassified Bacillus (in: firmicutes)]MBT2614804.1 carboxypeptidase [Bacillus sp. ISL-78]MBT2631898.1 carboxypeptidase [Bacillus sp. ISL-101]MBT2715785.1 carboxypeptidase [Bacillus sp. ISL-57]
MRKIMVIGILVLLFFPEPSLAAEVYSPEQMEMDLQRIQKQYELDVQIIGQTEKGKNIKAVRLGKGKKTILLVGSHHGREWLSSILLMRMLEEYAAAYRAGKPVGEFPSESLDEVSIWFIPMLNPDGVSIQQGDLSNLNVLEKAAVWKMNQYSTNWSRWKANAKGIDLNRQYPAGWKEVMSHETKPTYQFYKGGQPLEAAEVKALTDFTKEIDPLIAVSYHTSGREIFWHYKNKRKNMARDYGIAKRTAEMTGYELTFPEKEAVGSGFTDWFITEFSRPGMTIELSYLVNETNPPLTVFPEEWKRNRLVGIMLVKEAKHLHNN